MKKLIVVFFIPLILISCNEQKTYLSEEIKAVIPYKQGQKLIFESSSGLTNTLDIVKFVSGFPDGIGAPNNEWLHVLAYRQSNTVRDGTEEFIFSLEARHEDNEEEIHFDVSLKDASMHGYSMTKTEYQNLERFTLETEFQYFDDVIKFEAPVANYDQAICEVYWSHSKGYIRLIQKDGTVWDLKDINYR